jgi:hypothetical protein
MGSIGDVSTTTGSDVLKLRCPVGESKSLRISDVSGFVAGTIKPISDCLVYPFETVDSGILIAAYEIPRMMVSVLPASALIAGDKLSFRLSTGAFETDASEVLVTALALETKAAGVSEVLAHFNGFGFGDGTTPSDALYIV